ncbi:MAG TPA: hypothetical protein VMY39_07990 [Planctomycetota bacterium]|nr:hypothetical protein [Planctomycetota bacterium]
MSPLVLAQVPLWLHITGCVVIPLAWGVATELLFRWIGAHRRRRRAAHDQHFFMDYQI